MRCQVSASPPPARWYGSQIPGLLLLLGSALAAALAARAAEAAAAAGWLAGCRALLDCQETVEILKITDFH